MKVSVLNELDGSKSLISLVLWEQRSFAKLPTCSNLRNDGALLMLLSAVIMKIRQKENIIGQLKINHFPYYSCMNNMIIDQGLRLSY